MDILQLIEHNDRYRRPDISGQGDLWHLDGITPVTSPGVPSGVALLAPAGWDHHPSDLMTQKEYDKLFGQKFTSAFEALCAINTPGDPPRVVVAGGAANWPFWSHTDDSEGRIPPGDVDFFVLDPDNFWDVVGTLYAYLYDSLCADKIIIARNHVVKEQITPGLVTLSRVNVNTNKTYWKTQIILRKYVSISALLHSFDIGPSCVAYDGCRTWLTTLGVHATCHSVSVVNPQYRSPSYEKRLQKYFTRGYALLMPHLRPEVFQKASGPMNLPRMRLKIDTRLVSSSLWAYGRVGLFPGQTLERPSSGTGGLLISDLEDLEDPSDGEGFRAPALAPALAPDPTQSGYFDSPPVRPEGGAGSLSLQQMANMAALSDDTRRPFWEQSRSMNDTSEGVVLIRQIGAGEVDAAAFLTPDDIEAVIRFVSAPEPDAMGSCRHARLLHRWLGMTHDETCELMATIHRRALAESQIPSALQPQDIEKARQRLYAAYAGWGEKLSTKTQWAISHTPGTPYTCALNPRGEPPAAWYGEENAQDDDAVRRCAESSEPELSGPDVKICTICMSGHVPGEPDTVTLPCGHSFHLGGEKTKCGGIILWVGEKGRSEAWAASTCPVCRGPLMVQPPNCGTGVMRYLFDS